MKDGTRSRVHQKPALLIREFKRLIGTCERLRNVGTIGNDLCRVKDTARYPRKATLERLYCYQGGVSYLSSLL